MLKNNQGFPFFVDTLKFDLYEHLKELTLEIYLSQLSVHLFVLDLRKVKSSLNEILCKIAFRFLLHNLILQV